MCGLFLGPDLDKKIDLKIERKNALRPEQRAKKRRNVERNFTRMVQQDHDDLKEMLEKMQPRKDLFQDDPDMQLLWNVPERHVREEDEEMAPKFFLVMMLFLFRSHPQLQWS